MSHNIAIITSTFNPHITTKLYEGAKRYFDEKKELKVDSFTVPGAVEIPLFAKRLGLTNKYQAILALGCVIRGDTDHYDYVCQQISYGCQKVSLDQNIPVIFGILTTHDDQAALERVGGKEGHKGYDCAKALFDLLEEYQKIAR